MTDPGGIGAAAAWCRRCARPLAPGTTVHQRCEELPDSVNDWPDGRRTLACLACDRRFPSSSKAQRLCPLCRAGGGAHLR